METINSQTELLVAERSYGPGPDLDIRCADCGELMNLVRHREHHYLYYKCAHAGLPWFCRGVHSAHPDGSPMGTPADAETRAARRELHLSFDTLWQSSRLTRDEAYAWLAQATGKTKDQCHIGMFTKEECELAQEIFQQTFCDVMDLDEPD